MPTLWQVLIGNTLISQKVSLFIWTRVLTLPIQKVQDIDCTGIKGWSVLYASWDCQIKTIKWELVHLCCYWGLLKPMFSVHFYLSGKDLQASFSILKWNFSKAVASNLSGLSYKRWQIHMDVSLEWTQWYSEECELTRTAIFSGKWWQML